MSFASGLYWEARYRQRGNSGAGSYGQLAQFKADFINKFMFDYNVKTVIEFGSGDGNQLSLLNVKDYLGFDVSETIVRHLKQKFNNDSSKRFMLMSEYAGQQAELTLSLDVLFHLVEYDVFTLYMQRLFSSSSKFVIIYASNFEAAPTSPHMVYRKFTTWVDANLPGWGLVGHIKNKYPFDDKDPNNTSISDFFVYMKSPDRA